MPYSSFSRYLVRFLVVLAFGLIGAVLASVTASAQTTPPAQSPDRCATCHVNIVAAWQDGLHAQAYSDPIFQEAWEKKGKAVECLACHTTGFVARTGEYTAEGVTCEACHGVPAEGHPPAAVMTDPGVETCANCHATTFEEWQQSKHGEQQLACTTCHQAHPQQLRLVTEEEPNALCLNCHSEEGRSDFTHLVHAEQQCADCHWHRIEREDLIAHMESGALFPTGHSGGVGTVACVTCHETFSLTETGAAVAETQQELEASGALDNMHPLLAAQVKIEELEAEVDTVKSQGANTSSLRLAQGLVIGLALGGILVFGVTRFRRHAPTFSDHHTGE